jgi:hypothetical protein
MGAVLFPWDFSSVRGARMMRRMITFNRKHLSAQLLHSASPFNSVLRKLEITICTWAPSPGTHTGQHGSLLIAGGFPTPVQPQGAHTMQYTSILPCFHSTWSTHFLCPLVQLPAILSCLPALSKLSPNVNYCFSMLAYWVTQISSGLPQYYFPTNPVILGVFRKI